MPRLADSGNATEVFPQKNVGPEHALAAPGSNELFPERRSGNGGLNNHRFDVVRLRRGLKNGDSRVCVPVRLTDETDEGISECLREFSEVD